MLSSGEIINNRLCWNNLENEETPFSMSASLPRGQMNNWLMPEYFILTASSTYSTVSGLAWAHIVASDRKVLSYKLVIFYFEANILIKISLSNMRCVLQAFYRMKWSWKLKIRVLHSGRKAVLTGSGPGWEQYNGIKNKKNKKKLGGAGEVITRPVVEGHLDYIITS